ncbi:GNAT family N-acetyltransferase [Sinomicrobium soli]|uniref:GNAT family N-acetyltransferase n=1 Tax=Sinomicrobium sp. N-1-3-6 TaxID=2219864 RepID=UPI000DCB033F|nr:GNAT family N-acetyltransferase [Sinomicrobium sp. N-1-3-6]RAV30111.1 GNAT family N-acetyltransferase [Sinomicrobium sp. N-1-3-6]
MKDASHYQVKFIDAARTYEVRHPVLREGLPLSSCIFEGDDDPGTFHLGVFDGDRLAGVVTLLERNNPVFDVHRQFQLRGMAVMPEYRGERLGYRLVRAAEEEVMRRSGSFIWMNARKVAIGFYEHIGYAITGEEFLIETAGPHYLMSRFL